MKDKIIHIEIENKKYPLCFNLNVMEEIQDKYGTIQEWGKLVEGNGEPKIKELKYGFLSMINEGIDIENETNEIKQEFLTEKKLGRLLSKIDMAMLISKLQEVTINSTKTDEETKNV